MISHDRWFLDRIATHILAFEGNSRVMWFEGNYQEYEVDRRRPLDSEADPPHRIKYHPLVRAYLRFASDKTSRGGRASRSPRFVLSSRR